MAQEMKNQGILPDLLVLIDPWGGASNYSDQLARRVVKIPCPIPFILFPLWLPAHLALPRRSIPEVLKALDELKTLQDG